MSLFRGSSEFLLSVKGIAPDGWGELALLDSFEDGTTNTVVDISGDDSRAFCLCLFKKMKFKLEYNLRIMCYSLRSKVTYGGALVELISVLSTPPSPLTWALSRTLLFRSP